MDAMLYQCVEQWPIEWEEQLFKETQQNFGLNVAKVTIASLLIRWMIKKILKKMPRNFGITILDFIFR